MFSIFNKWLLDESNKTVILRRSTFWNLYSSILNSAMTAVIILFITMFGNQRDIGFFSLATGIAYQCQSIGNFGMRNFQSSDVQCEFSFYDYFNVRVVSSIMMYIVLLFYSFNSEYSLEKSAIILTYGLYRSIDALEDIFHGEYQRYNRLDIGVIFQSVRFTLSLIIMLVFLLFSKSLVVSCIAASLFSVVLFILQNIGVFRFFVKEKYQFNSEKIKKIIIMCFPICISGFISMYLINAPKYAIDSYLNNDAQSIFGVLVLPVTIISILSTVIYRPHITYISKSWFDRDFKTFKKIIFKQVSLILILIVIIVLGGYFIGLRLMEIIYRLDFKDYMLEFIIMLVGGGVYTLSQFFGIVVTIMRKQYLMFISYILVFLVILCTSGLLTTQFNMMGAILVYFIAVSLLAISLFIIVYLNYFKEKR